MLPRDVEVELTQMIRKAILAEGSSAELQQKLGRRPSAQELADKLGLQSESHLQLLHSNRRAAHLLMLRHNVRLVVHVARKYTHWGVDMVDLVAVSPLHGLVILVCLLACSQACRQSAATAQLLALTPARMGQGSVATVMVQGCLCLRAERSALLDGCIWACHSSRICMAALLHPRLRQSSPRDSSGTFVSSRQPMGPCIVAYRRAW